MNRTRSVRAALAAVFRSSLKILGSAYILKKVVLRFNIQMMGLSVCLKMHLVG